MRKKGGASSQADVLLDPERKGNPYTDSESRHRPIMTHSNNLLQVSMFTVEHSSNTLISCQWSHYNLRSFDLSNHATCQLNKLKVESLLTRQVCVMILIVLSTVAEPRFSYLRQNLAAFYSHLIEKQVKHLFALWSLCTIQRCTHSQTTCIHTNSETSCLTNNFMEGLCSYTLTWGWEKFNVFITNTWSLSTIFILATPSIIQTHQQDGIHLKNYNWLICNLFST